MAFGGFRQSDTDKPMAEINMIPLIDVMLVLLVIFIITTPLLTHAVKINLPQASSQPNLTQPEHLQLAIDALGTIYWNGESISTASMAARMHEAAQRTPQPELHIRAEKTTQYQVLTDVMAAASRAGLNKIGFVSDPRAQ